TLGNNKNLLTNNDNPQLQPSIILHAGIIKKYFFQLTKTEAECLYFLIRGYTSREVGDLLNKSHRTIESHAEKIKSKMNCHSKSQMINKAINSGYVHIVPESLKRYAI
ncbi:unnamed protein product, partial [marine sediment metagenome]